jgi:hypothetical protein
MVSLYETGQLLKLTPETISSKKKVCLVWLPLFTKDLGSEIREERILGSGIKHPGSATLQYTMPFQYIIIIINKADY